jgi:hypothetical protein
LEELQVPIRTVEVEVFAGGPPSRGTLFLGQLPDREPSAADVGRMLNDERPFLPFRDSAGHQSVLNKSRIARVRIAGATVADLGSGISPDCATPPCTVHMADGARLHGQLIIDTPASCSRMTDKLNRAPGFTPLVSEQGVDFLGIPHVVRVE